MPSPQRLRYAARYARGEGGRDTSENGPTGAAYSAAAVAERERRRGIKAAESAAAEAEEARDFMRELEVRQQVAAERGDEDEDGTFVHGTEGVKSKPDEYEEDSDEEFLAELEGDPELNRIRAARLQQIKGEQLKKQEMERMGHGRVTEIVQDEFLPRITTAPRCVVHFYHNDFHRCKIMDKHLEIIAEHHMETLFLKINAEKAPFFCEKLSVCVLPTVICFFEGKTNPTQRQIGFIDLAPVEGGSEDEWPTTALQAKLGATGVIDYVARATAEELAKYGLGAKSSISRGRFAGGTFGPDHDYDE